ncbi:cupin domain-containing protein [bacterium]|nr:cupin domain-containing protein [bacterium]
MDKSEAVRSLVNGGWKEQKFSEFRQGIEICWLRESLPQLALLRYAPGASVPRHRHAGLEIIQMLEGEQSDEHGTYKTGDVVLNPEGTEHSVCSDTGCVALLMWERPVEFV